MLMVNSLFIRRKVSTIVLISSLIAAPTQPLFRSVSSLRQWHTRVRSLNHQSTVLNCHNAAMKIHCLCQRC